MITRRGCLGWCGAAGLAVTTGLYRGFAPIVWSRPPQVRMRLWTWMASNNVFGDARNWDGWHAPRYGDSVVFGGIVDLDGSSNR